MFTLLIVVILAPIAGYNAGMFFAMRKKTPRYVVRLFPGDVVQVWHREQWVNVTITNVTKHGTPISEKDFIREGNYIRANDEYSERPMRFPVSSLRQIQ